MDLNQQFQVSIYLNNDTHDNGMTLKEYADAVLAGTHPILDHGNFDYQFGATDEDMALVSSWATKNGLTITLAESAIATINVEGTLGHIAELFSVTVREVVEEGRPPYIVHDDPVVVPSAIASAVREIGGFDQSFLAVRHLVNADSVTEPELGSSYGSSAVTPIQMSTAYNVPDGDGYGGCIGIFELSLDPAVLPNYNEGWQQPDVTASFSRIGITPAPSIITVNVNSAYFSPTSSAESMLDIYCAGGVAPRANIAYYIAPNSGTTNINNCINAAVNDTTNNPSVLSISWGIGDGTQFDTAFQACVAKGITVFVSSGDSGAVNLSMASTCCSAYIVSVGGTNVTLNGSNALTAEVAWGNSSGGGSSATGGGISASIGLPSWQSGLTYTTTTGGNATGLGTATSLPRRGVPDMSAPGDPATGWRFYYGGTSSAQGSLNTVGGTSASAPFIAGMWVRLNVLLGYRIPFNMATFYTNSATLFNDVAVGNNRAGYTTGYACTAGWDAVTGLGSPKGDQIYKYFHTGSTFPKRNRGFRPTNGPAYPRINTGART
jgi:kumamolisin